MRIAHQPANALEMFTAQIPDVALVDIGLPAMGGHELAQRMRASPGGDVPKLIAVTGYGLAADKEKAIKPGFDAHMAKPVSLERLSHLIDQLRGAGQG